MGCLNLQATVPTGKGSDFVLLLDLDLGLLNRFSHPVTLFTHLFIYLFIYSFISNTVHPLVFRENHMQAAYSDSLRRVG